MSDGRETTPAFSFRKTFLWTELFRCFWIALDPRKLAVAAAGIVAMSFGWYLISVIAMGLAAGKPERTSPAYARDTMKRALGKDADGSEFAPEVYDAEANKRFESDLRKWTTLNHLAGENGRMRTMPWNENRGLNPYLFVSSLITGSSVERQDALSDFFSTQLFVLIEPLMKMLLPVMTMISPDAGLGTRMYCLFCLLWSLVVWAFAGGVMTRLAAVQLSGKDRISLMEAVQFVISRYTSYVLAPVIPLAVIAVIILGLIVFGLIGLIPLVGDVLILGLFFPVILLAGIAMAMVLVGLVGYPLMYTTISVEGSDTFDALSRSYNYVYQAPWQFLWSAFVAVIYGMAVTFFVVFMGSFSVYLGKWGANQTASAIYSTHTPDYLYIYAPKTFGWRELLLKGSDAEQVREKSEKSEGTRREIQLVDKDPERTRKYLDSYWGYHHFAAWLVTFWLLVTLLLVLGFSYSYFWTAATMIYLLMRKHVDEMPLDDVFLEEQLPESPLTPLVSSPAAPSAPAVPPAPATVPFTPPAAPELPKPTDGPTPGTS